MNGEAGLHRGIATAAERDDAVKEIRFLLGQRQRIPAQLIGRGWSFSEWPAADEAHGDFFIGPVRDRRTNAIGPGATIGGARSRERRTAKLLGVKAEGMVLRRILAGGQRSGNRLRGKLIRETGLIPNLVCHPSPLKGSRSWHASPLRAWLRK